MIICPKLKLYWLYRNHDYSVGAGFDKLNLDAKLFKINIYTWLVTLLYFSPFLSRLTWSGMGCWRYCCAPCSTSECHIICIIIWRALSSLSLSLHLSHHSYLFLICFFFGHGSRILLMLTAIPSILASSIILSFTVPVLYNREIFGIVYGFSKIEQETICWQLVLFSLIYGFSSGTVLVEVNFVVQVNWCYLCW